MISQVLISHVEDGTSGSSRRLRQEVESIHKIFERTTTSITHKEVNEDREICKRELKRMKQQEDGKKGNKCKYIR